MANRSHPGWGPQATSRGLELPTGLGAKMSVPEFPPVSPIDRRRYEALLDMADLMVRHASLPDLFHEIAVRLRKVADFQLLNFSLHDPEKNVMRLHIWEGEEVPLVPTEVAVSESVSGWVWEHQKPLLIDDLRQEERFPQIIGALREKDFRAYCMLPLSSAQRRLGALGMGSHRQGAYTAGDLLFLRRVAELCAVVVESVFSREALHSEKERLRALVEVNRTLVSSLEMRRVLPLISDCVTRVVPHDFAGLTLFDPERKSMRAYVLAPAQEQMFVDAGRVVPMDRTLSASVFMTEHAAVFTADDLAQSQTPIASRVLQAGIRTVLSVPLRTSAVSFRTSFAMPRFSLSGISPVSNSRSKLNVAGCGAVWVRFGLSAVAALSGLLVLLIFNDVGLN